MSSLFTNLWQLTNVLLVFCEQVLQDLHAEHTTVTLDEQGSLVGIAPVTDLAKPLQEQCRRVALTCNELLRHFWACLPLTTQPRQEKARRLDRALQAQYDKCAVQYLLLEYTTVLVEHGSIIQMSLKCWCPILKCPVLIPEQVVCCVNEFSCLGWR